MKLSTALIRGSKGQNQKNGTLFSDDGKACCALGAISRGLGYAMDYKGGGDIYAGLIALVPVLGYTFAKPPSICGAGSRTRVPLQDIIWQLNDTAGWSFKQIAAWLRRKGL